MTTERRTDALSKRRIVDAAIEILDAEDAGEEGALTLRVLMTRLSTGSGAIYHHVRTMDELRAAAADDVLRAPLEVVADEAAPDVALRAAALGIFDSISAHPWVGAQLRRDALQPATVRIWKTLGRHLQRLDLSGAAGAAAGSTLASFILGSVSRFGSDASRASDPRAREAQLEVLAREWTATDHDAIVEDIASQLREHDDREQFLAGVDIVLAGIAATAP